MDKVEKLNATAELLKVVLPAVTRGVLDCYNKAQGGYFYQVPADVAVGIVGVSLQIVDSVMSVLEQRSNA